MLVDILHDEYKRRCAKNVRYSLRAFSKSLGISHTVLFLILAGKRAPSSNVIKRVGEKLRLSPFTLEMVRQLSKRARKPYSGSEISMEDFARIASWEHYAVLSLITMPEVGQDLHGMGKKLGLSLKEISRVFHDLTSIGLVTFEDGQWQQVKPRLIVNNKSSTEDSRKFIRNFLLKAIKVLEDSSFPERDMTTITFTMSTNDVQYAKERIKSFRRELCHELESRSDANRVYTLAVQLFPLSEVVSENTSPCLP